MRRSALEPQRRDEGMMDVVEGGTPHTSVPCWCCNGGGNGGDSGIGIGVGDAIRENISAAVHRGYRRSGVVTHYSDSSP